VKMLTAKRIVAASSRYPVTETDANGDHAEAPTPAFLYRDRNVYVPGPESATKVSLIRAPS
jgi:hypothetical protein